MHLLSCGQGAGTLIWLHATGFNARTYQSLLHRVCEQLPAWQLHAPDLRGHGLSELPADAEALKDWKLLAEDMRDWLEGLPAPVVLAGHSMGADLAIALATSANVQGLCLVEPVLYSPLLLPLRRLSVLMRWGRGHNMVSRARARRSHFASAEEALATYRGRGLFSSWPDQLISDYLQDGLRPAAGGGVELRCRPAWEAAIFTTQLASIWKLFKRVDVPMAFAAGDFPASTFFPGARMKVERRRPRPKIQIFPGAGHFLPLEQRDEIAGFIAASAQRFASEPG